MSTGLETHALPQPELVLRARAWRWAAIAPLVLAVPWLMLCRGLNMPAEWGTMRGLLLILLLLSATATDLLQRRIYNWTTYTTLGWVVFLELLSLVLEKSDLAAPVIAALGMLPWRESLLGFAAGFAILFVLYNVFRGGAGDLKLVAVIGALVGIKQIVEILVYSYILAGIFAACLVIGVVGPTSILASVTRGIGFGSRFAASPSVSTCLKRQVPMAPFIAGGALLALVLR